jgi:mono/diheme cytochrome c family protein
MPGRHLEENSMARWIYAAAGAVAAGVMGIGLLVGGLQDAGAQSAAPPKNVNDWLLNAPSDEDRFKKLQTFLRGFDQPMWEVGERYQRVYDALGDGNYDLAEYHWEKIKITIQTGYMKRPKRQPNADAMFVQNVYDPILAAIKSKDAAKAWDGFDLGRQACMACHVAEQVGFMNEQPLFRRTEKPPK